MITGIQILANYLSRNKIQYNVFGGPPILDVHLLIQHLGLLKRICFFLMDIYLEISYQLLSTL